MSEILEQIFENPFLNEYIRQFLDDCALLALDLALWPISNPNLLMEKLVKIIPPPVINSSTNIISGSYIISIDNSDTASGFINYNNDPNGAGPYVIGMGTNNGIFDNRANNSNTIWSPPQTGVQNTMIQGREISITGTPLKDTARYRWLPSEFIHITGYRQEIKISPAARVLALNSFGNQITVQVDRGVFLENINIIGNQLHIHFQTPGIYSNITIIKDKKEIIY